MVIGTSTLIFSVGFFIRSITPSYANNPNPNNTSNVASTNGYAEGNYVYFIDNGYMYQIQKGDLHMAFINNKFWNGKEVDNDGDKTITSQSGNGKTYSFASGETYIYSGVLLTDPITKIKRKSHFYYTKIE
jgi:hypothetical protein